MTSVTPIAGAVGPVSPNAGNPPFLEEWAKQNPDAFSVYEGRRPGSYSAAIHSHAQLLLEYAESNDARAKEIRLVVFRVGAHLNDITNSGEKVGTSMDISATEAHKIMQGAATEASTVLTAGQHAAAVAMGAARKLKLPKMPKKPPLQDEFVPYLSKNFDKRVDSFLQSGAYSKVDKDELKAVALLVHSAFIDEQLKKEEIGRYISGFTEAPNKNFLRTMVKVYADYADEKNPHAHLLDVVRRSAETGALGEQESFIAKLDKVKDGKIQKFKMIRSKDEAMVDEKADVKFVIVNVAYTPAENGHAVTFDDMVNDSSFDAVVDRITKSENIDAKTIECAVNLLRDPKLKKKACSMVVEFQLYLHKFLAIKKRLHGIYKFQRAQNLTDLVRDLVRYAVEEDMAYKTTGSEYNAIFVAKMHREWKKALRSGRLDLNEKLNVGNDVAFMELLMEQCKILRVTELFLMKNNIGDEAGIVIAKAIETNTTLKWIWLESNKLGDKAGIAFGKALEINTTVFRLFMNKNKLGDKAGKAIGKALETNKSMRNLTLGSNQLGDPAGKAIARALKINKTLWTISLFGNPFSSGLRSSLRKTFKQELLYI